MHFAIAVKLGSVLQAMPHVHRLDRRRPGALSHGEEDGLISIRPTNCKAASQVIFERFTGLSVPSTVIEIAALMDLGDGLFHVPRPWFAEVNDFDTRRIAD